MPVTNWTVTIIDGKEYLVIDTTQFRIPLDWDPSSNMFIAVAAPDGGLGGFPALVQGDDGETPQIDTVINYSALAWDDPTPDSASWTETSENVYKLNLTLHNGNPGAAGDYNLADANDLAGSMLPGKMIVVDDSGDAFEYITPKVGDEYWPATINSTPSGNPSYTLCSVTVPPQGFDWRPEVAGQTVVTGTGSNVKVDLVARLGNATSGNIIGRAIGSTEMLAFTAGASPVVTTNHVHPVHRLVSGPPTGSPRDWNKVTMGSSAVIYLCAERATGDQTFTTSATTTTFKVRVAPIP